MTDYRILVTGSRSWFDHATLEYELGEEIARGMRTRGSVTVVHGDCPRGADAMADNEASRHPCGIERHPADWSKGKGAGFARNAEMVRLGADVCLAFIRNGSPGATHTAGLAEKAGIPTRRYTSDG